MYKPTGVVLEATDEQLLNGITKEIGGFFRSGAPLVKTAQDREAYGYYVTGSGDFMNAWFSCLVNKIAKTVCFNRYYANHLAKFKKGMLGPGELVENIYLSLIMPVGYTSDVEHPGDCYAINKPECRAVYSPTNSRLVYPITTNGDELMMAITKDLQGFIEKIVGQLYNSVYVDEEIMTKYVLCRAILDNWDNVTKAVPAVTKETATDLVEIMKATSLDLGWINTKYNPMGVEAFTPIDRQHFFLTNKVSACVDTRSLSMAYNLDYMQFLGQREAINFFGFTDLEQARLDNMMSETAANGGITNYTPFTDEEKAKLKKIVACTIDTDFFMIFDTLFRTTAKFDELHLDTTLRVFNWKVYSYNPFAQIVAYVESDADDVTVAPMDASETIFGYDVSDLQTDVAVNGLAITGTLKYIDSGALPAKWGNGNFLALQFSSADWGAYDKIFVGLDPSESSGLADITDDPDRNGTFKVTNKATQKLVVMTIKGDVVDKKQYDLSGLTLNAS